LASKRLDERGLERGRATATNSGNVDDSKVKMDMDEIETLNIELEHRVTKLQEQGLVLAALKNELRKLKGKALDKEAIETHSVGQSLPLGKSSKKPHKPKSEDTNQEKLYLLHMDLCGPMRMIQVRLKETVRRIRTDNGTEFVNQTLREYYEKVGISHETSVARSPQQNGVVERRNRMLIEAARTMLIYAKAPVGSRNTSLHTIVHEIGLEMRKRVSCSRERIEREKRK
ncbi:putative ribonuclease H-like domain-containing protein, partial [Tanacetum coccineum]